MIPSEHPDLLRMLEAIREGDAKTISILADLLEEHDDWRACLRDLKPMEKVCWVPMSVPGGLSGLLKRASIEMELEYTWPSSAPMESIRLYDARGEKFEMDMINRALTFVPPISITVPACFRLAGPWYGVSVNYQWVIEPEMRIFTSTDTWRYDENPGRRLFTSVLAMFGRSLWRA